MKKSLTLVIAVYNAVQYLNFIFTALQRQSFIDFEVIVADDGSGEEIASLVHRVRDETGFSVRHLWQEDKGFRKNIMLNKAIHCAQTDYMVFIDGDCLPHYKFLHDHWTSRRPNTVLCGRRVNFSKQITSHLTRDDIMSGRYEKYSLSLLWDGFMARSSNLEDAIRIQHPMLRKIVQMREARILGCNFSVEKKSLEQINGFNEDYCAPGLGEDSDIAYRLALTGTNFLTLRYLAILYHLYHPTTHVDGENKRIYERVVATREPICKNGLRKFA